MYKNIIFDIGNVLLNFKPMDYLNQKLPYSIKVNEVFEEIYLSDEWVMLDRGVITEDEAIKELVNRSKDNGELIELAFESWYDMLTPIEGTINLLGQLKKAGIKLYFLSNFHHLAFENVISRYDFFNLFDGGVVSYKEKLIKPESAIYEKILNDFELHPNETIFVDDTFANVEGAIKSGIEGIVFISPEDLKIKLIKLGIKIQA